MKILVVDENDVNLKIYAGLVKKHEYGDTVCFSSSREALEWAAHNEVDLAIIDYNMPTPDGLECVTALRSMENKRHLPILMVTALHSRNVRQSALECGASDFLTKPLDAAEFSARLKNMLILGQSQKRLSETAHWLAEQVKSATAEITRSERETILKLSATAELRNPEPSGDLSRMASYCRCIAAGAGLSPTEQEAIMTAAPLRDLGMIVIPESILRKPAKLTPEEFELMQRHTTVGHEILKDSTSRVLQLAAEIALTHHEKYDGSGYPRGLKGESIPLVGRICALGDAFDALTSARPYKKAVTSHAAVAEINLKSGVHFDPDLVNVFNAVLPELLQIKGQTAEDSPSKTVLLANPKRSNGTRKKTPAKAGVIRKRVQQPSQLTEG